MDEENRRKYPRFPGGTVFTGQGPDGEVRATSTNQGPGGAFLETTCHLRPDTRLVLTVHDPFADTQPVFLVARVAFSRDLPTSGVGIEWKQAVSPQGLARLKQFLEMHFHLVVDPQKSGAYAPGETDLGVSYDFQFGTVEPVTQELLDEVMDGEAFYGIRFSSQFLPKARYLEVKLAASQAKMVAARGWRRELSLDARAMQTVDKYGPGDTTTQPISLERTSELGMSDEDLETWKYDLKLRKRTDVPIALVVGGIETAGRVRFVSSHAMFVIVDGPRPSPGERMSFKLPITVGLKSQEVEVVAEVRRQARDKRTGRVAIDLAVVSLDEGAFPGLYEQYLLAL